MYDDIAAIWLLKLTNRRPPFLEINCISKIGRKNISNFGIPSQRSVRN